MIPLFYSSTPGKLDSFCRDDRMDFSRTPERLMEAVFWSTIPMLSIDLVLLLVMTYKSLNRCKSKQKASLLTKVQFVILYIAIILQMTQLVLYNISTYNTDP